MNGIIKYVVLCDWFILLSMMFSGFNHVVAWINAPFLFFLSKFYLFIYLFIFGCIGSSLLHVGFLYLQ